MEVETTSTIPRFASTLLIAFPDVLMAGPRILLSADTQGTPSNTETSIAAWSHYCTPVSKKKSASPPTTDTTGKILYSAGHLGASDVSIGLLTVLVAPPTTEQASNLCEAIVSQAKASGTSQIILVASSNVTPTTATGLNLTSLSQTTHQLQISESQQLSLPVLPMNASLGDHILSTLVALLTFSRISTTALAILDDLVSALLQISIGGQANAAGRLFSAEKAFQYNISVKDEESSVGHLMYL
ncbi:hypothetical protein BGW38_010182 [Lunasporangiospora selenospora]|uniref:Proteasome assembly chaperone 2 n=1 Tax=Lunasporangiospora selenospora TaxID=979761 RepID=A0A9P6KFU8_9FUNG|nr:hypothetical protein BGW38_010182 [Lunasporangiospora selenospora]